MKGRVSSKACSATPDNMLSYEKEIPPTSSHTVKNQPYKRKRGGTCSAKRRVKTGRFFFCPWTFRLDGHDGLDGSLGLEVGIEEKRGLAGQPAVGVTNTPAGDANAVLDVNAALGDGFVVSLGGASDVELSNGNFVGSGTKHLDGSSALLAHAGEQVRLATDSVDGPAGSSPLGDVLDHGLQLGGVGVVEVEVVDVELGLGVLEGFVSTERRR